MKDTRSAAGMWLLACKQWLNTEPENYVQEDDKYRYSIPQIFTNWSLMHVVASSGGSYGGNNNIHGVNPSSILFYDNKSKFVIIVGCR